MPTTGTDLKKVHRPLYTATARPGLVEAPELPFLMIDGCGDPGADDYRSAVEALYAAAYAVRSVLKGRQVLEYPVMPMQGLWWTDDDQGFRHDADRAHWRWTMMILQPEQATEEVTGEAAAAAARKKPHAPVARVRRERLREGLCGQVLHTGPYSTERVTIDRLEDFLTAEGYAVAGRHHEIYLSNPARTAPEKMRTIIRYPVAPAG
ncbi:GyrI-like domain-containing protein [Streptomyces sp. NPDC018031]|uniref:GyrI-like domain-containing protein n=1 Tax=Streptomyces sp. NPDC018031 TaxID=3365033 RepID=UPI0037A3553A